MLRLGGVLIVSAALASCAFELSQPQPKMVWLRLDGQRGAGNPVLTQQFETDRTACLGTTQQSDELSQAVDAVARDCMAAKGYIQVPEDQAEAKSRELAAANAQRQAPTSPFRKLPGP
jgi:hypothetical protein